MDDLVTWLRATLDATESDARAFLDSDMRLYQDGAGVPWAELALAEVAAKRRILELHQRVDARDDWLGRGHPDWPANPACYGCHADFQEEYYEPDANNCEIARLLALPYADQPGYREEWHPSEPA